MRALRANALIGGVLIGTVMIVAMIAALWTPYDPLAIDLLAKLKSPSPRICSAPTSSAATC
jgi:peptide/nickel transport system permease protein